MIFIRYQNIDKKSFLYWKGFTVKVIIILFFLAFDIVVLLYGACETENTKDIVPAGATDVSVEEDVTEETPTQAIQVFSITEEQTEETQEEDPIIYYYTEQDIIDIAKVLYKECRGNKSKTEQACVVWTVLNRVDMKNSTVYDVVRAANQFAFYENTPVWDNLYELARDVLERWNREKNGLENIGRVLPINYLYFHGANGHNWFKNSLNNYTIWDYSLESPYES